ncbi:TPA: hypothetical protein ACXIMI_000142 [Stenotrophomonas maltophilia]
MIDARDFADLAVANMGWSKVVGDPWAFRRRLGIKEGLRFADIPSFASNIC